MQIRDFGAGNYAETRPGPLPKCDLCNGCAADYDEEVVKRQPEDRAAAALDLFQQAYRAQTQGLLDLAVTLYKQSIALFPTAEAYTFLGWTYHFQGKTKEAIEECKNAIVVDPAFGNPYNDIGAYLIELGELDEAVGWLERAIASQRYKSYHYPWYNLGRVYAARDLFNKARECFEKALAIEPTYALAAEALAKIKRLIQ